MIDVTGIDKRFGGTPVLDDISFTVDRGEIVVCVGPSGAGKTTLLRIIAGTLEQDAGEVAVDGDIGMVFQEPRLLPWRTLEGNVQLIDDIGEAAVTADRVADVLELVELVDAADRYPGQLSGGMRQRAAFARALAADPSVMLMDEPFSSLDFFTKERVKSRFHEILEDRNLTTLMVTHDLQDAVDMGDRVIVLDTGPARVLDTVDTSDTDLDALLDRMDG